MLSQACHGDNGPCLCKELAMNRRNVYFCYKYLKGFWNDSLLLGNIYTLASAEWRGILISRKKDLDLQSSPLTAHEMMTPVPWLGLEPGQNQSVLGVHSAS